MKLSPVPIKVIYELTHYRCESCGYESYLVGIFPSITRKYQLEDGSDVSGLVNA